MSWNEGETKLWSAETLSEEGTEAEEIGACEKRRAGSEGKRTFLTTGYHMNLCLGEQHQSIRQLIPEEPQLKSNALQVA